MMHFLTLLRHGESEGNLSGTLQGQQDFPLTKAGVEQATRLAGYWKSTGQVFDLIVSSPLKRASQTAEIISDMLTVPIVLEPSWMERHFGSLQGMPLDQIDRAVPPIDFFHPFEPIGETGESQLDLYLRAGQAIQKIIQSPPGSYLAVSHGGILNKALYVVMGIAPQGHYNSPIFHFGNTGYAQFRYHSLTRQWAVINLNNQYPPDMAERPGLWKLD